MKKFHMVIPFVVGIITNEKDEVLIGKRIKEPYKGRWGLPGGKLEENETLLECLKREVKEETGYDIKNSALFDVFHHNQKAFLEDYKGGISGLGVTYIVEVSGKLKPSEMIDTHFASEKEIRSLRFTPWAKESLLKYFETRAIV